jgi:outer membrane protein assembly factor BamB
MARKILLKMLAGTLSLSIAFVFTGCEQTVQLDWKYPSQSACYSSPALTDDAVVFGTESGEVHAVSKKDGRYRWKFQARKPVISAPAIYDNVIVFGSTNHNFYAVDKDGRQIWRYPTFDRIKGDPIIIGNSVVFGSYDGHLYSLNLISSELQWTYPAKEAAAAADMGAPAAAPTEEGTAAPAAAAAPGAEGAAVAAVAEAAPKPDVKPGKGFAYSKPLLTSTGLIVNGNLDGYVYAVDGKTGEFKWRFATDGAKQGLGVTSTVLEYEGSLFFGANDGNVYAIKMDDQSVVWKIKTGDEINSSPVVDSKGVVFVGSRDKNLYAIDAKTGEQKWQTTVSGPILAIPAVNKNLVLVGAGEGDGHVYLINTKDGSIFWKYKTDNKIEADSVFDGDHFYVASGDSFLYAFKINKFPE